MEKLELLGYLKKITGNHFSFTYPILNMGKGVSLLAGRYTDRKRNTHLVVYLYWIGSNELPKNKLVLDNINYPHREIYPVSSSWLRNQLYLRIIGKEFFFQMENFR